MAIGFDFGTANCSVARIVDEQVRVIPLSENDVYLPSTLSAPNAETVSEYLFKCLNIKPANTIGESVLRRAIKINHEEGLNVRHDDVHFGQSALDLYLDDPKYVYYVQSPKSFLGTQGLRDVQLSYFEDLICAMMANVKQQVEKQLDNAVSDVVIGRPVNFHGRGGEKSNIQAEGILRSAARRVGFKNIEFQFEPVAAGFEYESTLTADKTVLVVDIGGGTSDCSLINMGPSWQGKANRTDSLLSHSGLSVGGNDLDIAIAFKKFMSEFGLGTEQLSGLPVPISQFWNCVAINDVIAQRDFYTLENLKQLLDLTKNAKQPEKIRRLSYLHKGTLGHSVVREAELAKIALGKQEQYVSSLNLLEDTVELNLLKEQMADAISEPVRKITRMIKEAEQQGQTKPDVVYMTGGSARSPILRAAIKSVLPNTEIVSGSYFGSVTAGLSRWADVCFK
ncbi:molecular chaperone [Vibrio algarum]|uniref:Molecular chaperone n=1 Tax=Vibrio algarum TaxID=3020714 RepID=A0ABT4YW08_9VIBR|nr:molecular chaperone [Vibrio sp. KJ40-1]MDB1125769.1 molecular chaperone [Vibrio sp. KJ40-1]